MLDKPLKLNKHQETTLYIYSGILHCLVDLVVIRVLRDPKGHANILENVNDKMGKLNQVSFKNATSSKPAESLNLLAISECLKKMIGEFENTIGRSAVVQNFTNKTWTVLLLIHNKIVISYNGESYKNATKPLPIGVSLAKIRSEIEGDWGCTLTKDLIKLIDEAKLFAKTLKTATLSDKQKDAKQ